MCQLYLNTLKKKKKKIVTEISASSEVLLGKDMLSISLRLLATPFPAIVGLRIWFLAGCGLEATLG